MTLPDLDIDALRAFVTVAEAGGFTAAAERLGRTQSAISVKIKKLEDTLGRRLFERTSRSLSVTHDGELLLGYARRLLELNDETVRRFAEPAAEGELRLGVAEYFLSDHLPRVLTQFAKIYPRLHIDVRVGLCGDLVGGLDSGELDLVISRRDPGETRGRGIWREPMRWVAAPTLELAPDAPLPFCALPAPCVFRNRGLAALGGDRAAVAGGLHQRQRHGGAGRRPRRAGRGGAQRILGSRRRPAAGRRRRPARPRRGRDGHLRRDSAQPPSGRAAGRLHP
ncbi:LysR family transcriptional regulator [Azospirillum doebereinerae]|uniref:LysR family transcriptional regulator n=1 Tax=Azospirillum doebereinerae TaxID=92933 RepID=UPI00384BF6D9